MKSPAIEVPAAESYWDRSGIFLKDIQQFIFLHPLGYLRPGDAGADKLKVVLDALLLGPDLRHIFQLTGTGTDVVVGKQGAADDAAFCSRGLLFLD